MLDGRRKHASRDKEQDLRDKHPQGNAHAKRDCGNQQRLQRKNHVHLPRTHTQHLVETKLLLAPAHEEVVRVHHEKAKDHGEKDGKPIEDLSHLAERLAHVAAEKVALDAHGVERIEHGHAQHKREEVHGIVMQELAHVAKGKLSEHRRPLPARPQPA